MKKRGFKEPWGTMGAQGRPAWQQSPNDTYFGTYVSLSLPPGAPFWYPRRQNPEKRAPLRAEIQGPMEKV